MGFFDNLANQLTNQITNQLSNGLTDFRSLVSQPSTSNPITSSSGGINDPDFSIDGFRTNLSGHSEVAKADKFTVQFMVPQEIVGGDDPRSLTLQCEVSELPGRDINMIEFRHYGFTKRIPHQNQYGIVTFTFYCAGDMWEKKLFDRWLDIMVPTESGLVAYPLDDSGSPRYECDVLVNQYTPMGDLVYQVKLIDAVPTGIGALNQDWNNDSIHRLVVTFAFRKWTTDAITSNGVATDFSPASGTGDQAPTGDGSNNFTNENQTPIADQRGLPTTPPNPTSFIGG